MNLRLLTIFSGSRPKKTRVIAVTDHRIISSAMDARVKKNTLLKHHERDIISLLKRAYFSNPGDNSGFFFRGGQQGLITLFTRTPEGETGPVLRLFSNTGDEVTKKGR
jgi:hypothetical protein